MTTKAFTLRNNIRTMLNSSIVHVHFTMFLLLYEVTPTLVSDSEMKLMYCAPAWHGFCSASDYVRRSFLRRCVKLGHAGQSATVTDMFSEADDVFFRKILYNKTHVLHSYLPDRPILCTRFAPDLIISLLFVKAVTSTIATF